METSTKVVGTAKASRDYLKELDEDYTPEPNEHARNQAEYHDGKKGAKGNDIVFDEVWGTLGRELGIEAGITAKQFDELFDGKWDGAQRTHLTGSRSYINAEGEKVTETKVHTPAFNIVYAPPKSVSELFARARSEADAQAIKNAVLESARLAFNEGLEPFARVARVRKDGVITDHTARLVAIPVVQTTARPTAETIAKGHAGDPHLHVHVFMFTACKVGNRWYTADSKQLKRTAEYRGMGIFRAELARRMEALGHKLDYEDFDLSRNGHISFEASASDPKIRKHLSKNANRLPELVRTFEKKYGRPPTKDQEKSLLRQTKGPKTDKEMDSSPNRERWMENLREDGFDPTYIEPAAQAIKPPADREQELFRRLMGAKGLVRKDATFSDESIKPAVTYAAVGLGFTWDEINHYTAKVREQLVLARPANEPQHRLFTTRPQLARELFLRERAEAKLRVFLPAVPWKAVEYAIRKTGRKADEGQLAFLKEAASGKSLVIVTGDAGSGKSWGASVFVDALRSARMPGQIIGVAVSGKTANDFCNKIKADRGGSIDSILFQLDRGMITLSKNDRILVDEAAMVDTTRMADLMAAAGEAQVILIGDPAQLPPIGSAGHFHDWLNRHGSVHIDKVHRQRNNADINDYRLLRTCQGHLAVRRLHDRGRIHVDMDGSQSMGRAMRDYDALRAVGVEPQEIRFLIDSSNKQVDMANRFVQNRRIAANEVDGRGFRVEERQQARSWNLHAGDQVLFIASYKEVGKATIRNGTEATLVSIDHRNGRGNFDINGEIRNVALGPHVGLAYAQHVNKMQGGEVEHILNLSNSPFHVTANSGYSANTRAKHEAHTYIAVEDWAPEKIMDGRLLSDHECQERALHALGEALSREDVKEGALGVIEQEIISEVESMPDYMDEIFDRDREDRERDLVRDLSHADLGW